VRDHRETEAGGCYCECAGCAVTSANVNPPSGEVCTAGDQQVQVSWTPGASTDGTRVFQPSTTLRYIGSGTSYTQTGLANGTAYTYRLRGYIDCTSASPSGVGFAQSSSFVECSATPVAGTARPPSVGFWSMFLEDPQSPGPE